MNKTTSTQCLSMKPCPVCKKSMTVRQNSAIVEGGCRKWFYFLYCSECGYGPHHAFDNIKDAYDHWNKNTNTMDLPPVGFFFKKPPNSFMYRPLN